MPTLRAHIVLPAELVEEIDELVGPRGRSAFLSETAAKEIKRRKLLAFLEGADAAWKDGDHPEFAAQGTADWVRALRNEPSARLEGRDRELE